MRASAVAIPPPPHDPRERVLVSRAGELEVRAFAEGTRMHGYLARHGMLHVQLWHPERRVSVLTPSRLTAMRWEVFPIEGWKLPVFDIDVLRGAVERKLGVTLPSESELEALQVWFVDRAVRNELRTHEVIASAALSTRATSLDR